MFPLKDSVVWLIQSNIIGFPIQASTGGGGTYRRQKTIRSGIPNPRSHEGSDRVLETRAACLCNFNPRSHEGSDVVPLHRLLPRQDFNPRSREGSDLTDGWNQCRYTYFNPRSREGSDTRPARRSHPGTNFNPRSREGSDGPICTLRGTKPNFNPRSREGSDSGTRCTSHGHAISIHAPVKGATRQPQPDTVRIRLFQSTLP